MPPAFGARELAQDAFGPNRCRDSLPINNRMTSTTKVTPTLPLAAVAPSSAVRPGWNDPDAFRDPMNALKIAGIALIAAGVLALVYGGFPYTKESHEARIGPIESASAGALLT